MGFAIEDRFGNRLKNTPLQRRWMGVDMKIQEFIMQNLPDRIDSKYRFVLLASERAEQLMQGALPRIRTTSNKPTQVAMAEVFTDSVDWDYGPAPAPEVPEEDPAEESAEGEAAAAEEADA